MVSNKRSGGGGGTQTAIIVERSDSTAKFLGNHFPTAPPFGREHSDRPAPPHRNRLRPARMPSFPRIRFNGNRSSVDAGQTGSEPCLSVSRSPSPNDRALSPLATEPDSDWTRERIAEVYGRWLGCIWDDCHGLMLEKKAERVFDCSDCGRRATIEYLRETGRI